jgi:hypothetical protein
MTRSTDVDSGVVMAVVKTGGALRLLQVRAIEVPPVPLPSRCWGELGALRGKSDKGVTDFLLVLESQE